MEHVRVREGEAGRGIIGIETYWGPVTAAMRRPRRKHRAAWRGDGGAPPEEWMEEVLISETRKAERGTWETSVGLA